MTNAELAILGLVAEKPRHGYEIEQVIEGRGMRDWTEVGFSSIYYLLKKLEDKGYITSEMKQPEGRGPARKVYSITEAGGQAWYQASLDALRQPPIPASGFLLGLSVFPAFKPEDAEAALQDYMELLQGRLANVTARRKEQQPLPPYIDAMFDYSQTLIEAEIGWLERFIRQMRMD